MQKKLDNPQNHMSLPDDYFKTLCGKVLDRIEIEQNCNKSSKGLNVAPKKINFPNLFKWSGVAAVACGIVLTLTISGIFSSDNEASLPSLYASSEITTISEDDYYQFLNDLMNEDDNNNYWMAENTQSDIY